MSGPLLRAVEGYLARDMSRFHMPGHKGIPQPPFGEILRYDVTEIPGTDSLYEADEAIAETEAAFARLYNAAGSFLSAGGSTLCIQAMLALAAGCGTKILAARGVHAAALNAMALLGLEPVWLFPESDALTGLSAPVTAGEVRSALAANPDVKAVYITSPTYYGVLSDVKSIAKACRAHNVPLLVDNAHGAHLRFLPLSGSLHPMDNGADMCCDSLHKTLPVLTGGALLHIANPAFLPDAKRRMSLFGSTSPSYLIMLSADSVLGYLEEKAAEDLARVAKEIAALKAIAKDRGFLMPSGLLDPIRLTLGFSPLGFTAETFRAHLADYKIEPELCADGYAVFLAGGMNRDEDFRRLRSAIEALPSSPAPDPDPLEPFKIPARITSIREAVFAPSELVPVEQAAGRIAASSVSVCPPGIPIAVPGERIDENMTALLKKYGILSLNVLR